MSGTSERRRAADKISAWERHGQSILASLVLAGIISVSVTQNSTSTAITEMKGNLKLVEFKVTMLQTQVANAQLNNYSKVEAEAEIEKFDIKLKDLDKRVSALEKRSGAHRGK